MSRYLFVICIIALALGSSNATDDESCGDSICSDEYEPLCVYDWEDRCFINAGNPCAYEVLACQNEFSEFLLFFFVF